MPDLFTPATGLRLPALNDPAWNVKLNANASLLDGLGGIGPLCVSLKENPSTSLNVKVAAGSFRSGAGVLVTYAGSGSFGLTASATNWLYLTDSGTLTKSTTSFPTTGNYVPLAIVIAGSSTIASNPIPDARTPWFATGGHIGFGVGSPAIVGGAGAGTGPTLTIVGSDQAGYITVLTGTSPTASATVATITFGQPFVATPRMVSIRSANGNAAALSGNAAVWADQGGLSTTVFTLSVGSTNLAATTTYLWWYEVLG